MKLFTPTLTLSTPKNGPLVGCAQYDNLLDPETSNRIAAVAAIHPHVDEVRLIEDHRKGMTTVETTFHAETKVDAARVSVLELFEPERLSRAIRQFFQVPG